MLLRVIHKTVRRSGAISEREELLDVEQATIGRSLNSDIPLPGLSIEMQHSRLEKLDDGVHLIAADGVELEVNGRRTERRLLRPKDAIRIGGFELRVLPSGEGDDLCIELSQLERRQSERQELDKRTRIGLGRGLFTERKLSWLSVFAIPGIFLGIPLVTQHKHMDPLWDSGPIARVHGFIADDCQKCHAVPFERVRDQECLVCHGDVRSHTPSDLQVSKLDETRCASCHLEHGGELGLAALQQELCSDCHGNLGEQAPKTKVKTATDFAKEHPQFRLAVPTETVVRKTASAPPRGDSIDWTRVIDRVEWSKDGQEHSGVKFNHLRHVAQEERADGSGQLLSCGDCHQPDKAGKNMAPINFEQHCQSCHSLGFDRRYQREAVHGDPVAMRADLQIFYEAKETEAIERQIRQGQVRRAIVGSTEETEQRQAAQRNARSMVLQADQFLNDEDKPGACANCHFVKKGAASDGGFDVAPVRLLDLWLPKSVFRHVTHGPFPCQDCHPRAAVYDSQLAKDLADDSKKSEAKPGIRRSKAQLRPRPDWSLPGPAKPYALSTPEELFNRDGLKPSEKAVDILIPGIEKCQSCHGGGHSPAPKVRSECVLCHPFHREEFDRMRALPAPGSVTDSKTFNSTGAD